MDYFDRFDICEAYQALENDYNVGGRLDTRRESVAVQLHRIDFQSGHLRGDYEHLTENGQMIYNTYVERHNLPTA